MKYLFIGVSIFILSACTWASDEGSEIDQSYLNPIENASPEIIGTKEFADCVGPTIKMCISQSANDIARKQGSTELCWKLDNSEEINSCKYGVIVSNLSNNNRMSTCDVLDEKYKKECRIASINLSASSEENLDTCDQIAEEFSESESENSGLRVDQCKFPIIMKRPELKTKDCDELFTKAQKDTCVSLVKSKTNQK